MSASFDHATVTIPYAAVEELKGRVAAAEAKTASLERDLLEQRLGGPEDSARVLHEALGHALPIIGFAIASLPPLAVRGWPYASLVAFVQALPKTPGAPVVYTEVVNDFLLFARDCERWEKARALGKEQELFAEENASRAVGPGAFNPAELSAIDELTDH